MYTSGLLLRLLPDDVVQPAAVPCNLDGVELQSVACSRRGSQLVAPKRDPPAVGTGSQRSRRRSKSQNAPNMAFVSL